MSNEIILALNPGSTSTKLALFDGEREILRETLAHTPEELGKTRIQDQLPVRLKAVREFLNESGYPPSELSLIAARGGFLPPINAGAYRVDLTMVDYLSRPDIGQHASNLAAQIAFLLSREKTPQIPAIIYDGVTTDQLCALARYSGSALFTRESVCHCLNMRAVAMRTAREMDREYGDVNFIVVHLGGGISLSLQSGGRLIDIVSDDEGPMSPERSGKVPCLKLIRACYSGEYNRREMLKAIRGNGGIKSYLGTTDIIELEKRIENGDGHSEEILRAMVLQTAKGVGELSVVVDGQIDRIIITGGLARSEMVVSWLMKRIAFLAPITVIPGEFELEALAEGGLRVLRGEEPVQALHLKDWEH